jgi:hypothetical protein
MLTRCKDGTATMTTGSALMMHRVLEDSSQKGRSAEFEAQFAWNWFQYHAGQRLTSFNFFLIIVGLLLVGYAHAVEQEWRGFGIAIGLLGAIVAAGFLALDIRNDELVQCGLFALEELENEEANVKIIAPNKERKYLEAACGRGSLGEKLYKRIDHPVAKRMLMHSFLLRFVIAAVSLGYVSAAIWAAAGFPGA